MGVAGGRKAQFRRRDWDRVLQPGKPQRPGVSLYRQEEKEALVNERGPRQRQGTIMCWGRVNKTGKSLGQYMSSGKRTKGRVVRRGL